MFPIYLNVHATKLSLKKLLEAVEEYTSFLAKEADDLLEFVQMVVSQEQVLSLVPSSMRSYEIHQIDKNSLLEKDILSIFFSPEVKELGKKKTSEDEGEEEDVDISKETVGTLELDKVPSPIYRVSEGLPCPTIDEHMHPDGEVEFMSTFKYRGPLCTYLDTNEMPQDLQRASQWLARYLQTVARLLLTKVKEIETGLSIAALKERGEEEQPALLRPRQKSEMRIASSSRLLSQYMSSKRLRFSQRVESIDLQAKMLAESTLSGFKEKPAEEEESALSESDIDEDDERRISAVASRRSSLATLFGDSPFYGPKEESPEELEAFADLMQQLDAARLVTTKIKLKNDISPQYLVQKCSQIIQNNNLIQLENTAIEIFLAKQRVPIDLNQLAACSRLQPTWGQVLSDCLVRLQIFKSDDLSTSVKDTKSVTDFQSSDTKTIQTLRTPTPSGATTSSSVDSDLMESISGNELCRYVYTPPTEVISFEPLTSNHIFGVKPPHYRFMPVEEAVRRADEKRDLSKRIHQMKREIVRTFSKEPESDSDSDDGEESGWRKWFCPERRQDLVNKAIDSLILLNEAQHHEALKTLEELAARKDTINCEYEEKSENVIELKNLQRIKETPLEKRLLFQRKFSDALYKTMKGFLAEDLKRKNLMLARQRTLSNEIAELSKTVRHIEQLERKTDWGDLALQRLQHNSALRRNVTIDEDINELKKLNATYTLKLIHAREELDAQLRENKNLMKDRDLSLKKKNSFKETFVAQHKKLVDIQESLMEAPKISDIERFVMQARTEDYKKKKMRHYQTELEVRQANKRVKYLQNRINGLSMEPRTYARLKERNRKIVQTEKFVEFLHKFCKEAEKEEFGVHVTALEPP